MAWTPTHRGDTQGAGCVWVWYTYYSTPTFHPNFIPYHPYTPSPFIFSRFFSPFSPSEPTPFLF
jgi:hypothetical protein